MIKIQDTEINIVKSLLHEILQSPINDSVNYPKYTAEQLQQFWAKALRKIADRIFSYEGKELKLIFPQEGIYQFYPKEFIGTPRMRVNTRINFYSMDNTTYRSVEITSLANKEEIDYLKSLLALGKGVPGAYSLFDVIYSHVELVDVSTNTFISDATAAELKQRLQGYGVNPLGMSVKAMEEELAKQIWNEEHPGEEFPEQYDPMLIHDLTGTGKENISKNYHSDVWRGQRKINGMRCIASISPNGKVTLTSRAKSVKTFRFSELDGQVLGLQNIKSPFKQGNTVLDGEILMPLAEIDLPSGVHTTSTLQSTVSLMHLNQEQSLAMQKKYGSLILNVFDILKLNGTDVSQRPYEERADLVVTTVEAFKSLNPSIALEAVPVVKDYEDAWSLFQEYLSKGEEGIILKRKDAPYEFGKRTRNQYKIKGLYEFDAFITGFVPASPDKGLANYIGGFIFSAYVDGQLREVASVASLDMKTRVAATDYDEHGNPILKQDWYNKVYMVACQDFNKKSLKANHARIVEARPDKKPEDCNLYKEDMRFNTAVS